MPKKSAAVRNGAQRNKPRVQKSIELVRRTVEEQEPFIEDVSDTPAEVIESQTAAEQTPTSVSTAVALDPVPERTKNVVEPLAGTLSGGQVTRVGDARTAAKKKETVRLATPDTQDEEVSPVSSKGTAASRLAARRQSVQKTQQRAAANLITAEHYGYVRRDLIIIAVLAFIMFATIIALHFVPAIGG